MDLRAATLLAGIAVAACSHDVASAWDADGGGTGSEDTASSSGGGNDSTAGQASSTTSGGATTDSGGSSTASETSGADGTDDTTADSGTTGDNGALETDGSGSSGDATGGDDTGGPVGSDACGFLLDGPWVEIEYSQAGGSPQSPSWEFSETPGWGAAQWATTNESWPEVWDLWQNIDVGNDPIGVLAVVGPSAQLQLMIGLQDLASYSSATVCIEGRSVSATASVLFDAYNPLTGLGASSSMAHDWNMHAVGLDLGQAFQPGGGVQAVRIDPTGGSSAVGIRRLRLILHNASY